LPLEDQQQLMFAIEQIMELLQGLEENKEQDNADHRNSDGDAEGKQIRNDEALRLEGMYQDLLASHKRLQASQDETIAEKQEFAKELNRYKEEVEQSRNLQADVLMRQEIERLKEQLRKSEDNLAEAEVEVERLGKVNGEMTRKTEDLQRKADEGVKLKDQMEEYKHAADRLQKTENVIEKYKKKLEEGADVRRQLKLVESQYAELIDRNATVEDEYKRVASFKPLMESYKEQISELEAKASTLQRDLNAARYEKDEIVVKLRATEEARASEKEEMDLYQERIQELELSSGIGKRRKGADGDVNGVEGLAANNEMASSEDDDITDENIDDALNGVTMTGLKIKVRKLARDLRAAKANKADAGRLVVLENLLEDANKMKARYEKDYLREYQKSLVLERTMDDILDGKAGLGDGPEANYALRLRLNETVDELDLAKKEISRLTVDHEQTSRALTIARSDLTLVGRDKLDMLEELRLQVNGEKADLEKQLQHLQEELKIKLDEERMNISQINALLMEKIESTGHKDGSSPQSEQKDASPSEEQEEIVSALEAQLQTTQDKLRKARDFIRQQDKLLQDAKNKSSITPQEVLQKSKKTEQENAILRQEQRLMASAYYELQQRLNRELMMNGTFRKNGSNRAQTKAGISMMGNKPKSWLLQQRNELAGGISLARR
jgi:protein HOOK3